MAFPPNYRQERNSRDRAKQQKALEKQQKREEKSAQRSTGNGDKYADMPQEKKE